MPEPTSLAARRRTFAARLDAAAAAAAAAQAAADAASRKADKSAAQVDLFHQTMQRVEGHLADLMGKDGQLEQIKALIGEEHENERGEKLGTGLMGRLMRHELKDERRFAKYHRWQLLASGFIAALVLFGPVIWWLVADRLAFLK